MYIINDRELYDQLVKRAMNNSALTVSIRVIKTGKLQTIIIMANGNNMLTEALFSSVYRH